jgi:hypothetical protein
MINYQVPDYVENNDLVCFGISSHEIEEWRPNWTPKARREIEIVASWFKREDFQDYYIRHACRSDWNYTNYATRAQVQNLLALLAIRELPIKNFYARCWVMYFYVEFFMNRGIGRGFHRQKLPVTFYDNYFMRRDFLNYPDLLYWNIARVLPRNPPVPDAHREWRTRQFPVFHDYHRKVYRYRFRKPRYVPWDGSMNQPIMPYLHDQGTDVINGTWRRNTNSFPSRK